ncbi:hypothetical protein NITLEN_20604 [Nitrospira lenta]|uniref:GH16 domain-containing protein n=1 Tax=Nitrospira lenta TaxID=1436998 RepID=A0A330L552_9BACT|nr:hypothetical protein NITLEN_20604 [Nitrospira lenta]
MMDAPRVRPREPLLKILPALLLAMLLGSCTSDRPLPQDPLAAQVGLAAQYPGDAGIERDPAVLFAEDFDHAPLTAILARFSDRKRPASFSLAHDGPSVSPGQYALKIASVGGVSTGGTLYKRLAKNYDLLYFRYYVKYPSGGTYHHTAGWLGGYNPPTDWPQGHAGIRPSGNDRLSIAAEPVDANGRLDFYTYWMGMHGGPVEYWGNFLIHDPSLVFSRDRWTCIEVMAKMNDPVSAFNGELALWVDDTLVSHLGARFPAGHWTGGIFTPDRSGEPFEGFQWRHDAGLALNWFWLQHYATADPTGYAGAALFDHVVLATNRIGCLAHTATPPANLNPVSP